MQKKGLIKIGIAAYSLLAMGAIGINSVLHDIAEHFHITDTEAALMASIPCMVTIVVTLFLGKVLEHISQKKVGIFGAVCFLAGGLLPLVIDNLIIIFICRAVLGIGIAISQVFMATLVAEFFEEKERPPVQGLAQSAQTAGMIIMCLISGFLATISWRTCFWVHAIGALALLAMIFCIPERKPDKNKNKEAGPKAKLTKASIGWFALMFFVFLILLTFANNISFLLVEKGIGTAADTGIALSIYAGGGLLTGLFYGKIDQYIAAKKLPLSMFLFALMFLIVIFAKSLVVVYIGSFIGGIALSLYFPQIILFTNLSVDPVMIPVAISFLTCVQNLGQILCPYAVDFLVKIFAPASKPQQTKFLIALIGFLILTAVTLVYAVWRDKKDRTA